MRDKNDPPAGGSMHRRLPYVDGSRIFHENTGKLLGGLTVSLNRLSFFAARPQKKLASKASSAPQLCLICQKLV